MKKNILAFLLLVLTIEGNAQVKRVSISETKIGTVNCLYGMSVDLEKGDTTTYIHLGFQNAKYSSITDIKSIFFVMATDSNDVSNFVKDLKMALGEMESKESISWDKKKYSLTLYDFSNSLYLREARSDGDGHTMLSKKQVEKLISWLESIGFKL